MYLPIFCRCGFLEAFHYSWPMKPSNFLIFLKTQYLHSPLHFETILYYMVHVLLISAAQDITSMHSSRMSTSAVVAVSWGGGGSARGGVYPSMHRGRLPLSTSPPPQPLWTEFLTHACENITLPQAHLSCMYSSTCNTVVRNFSCRLIIHPKMSLF